MTRHLLPQFTRFAMVGVIGFFVDVGILLVLIRSGWSPILARIPASATAILVTWLLNRSLTFRVRSRKSPAEAMRYALIAVTSALLNFALYSTMVLAGVWPAPAVVFATVILMLFSFLAYKRYAFRQSIRPPEIVRLPVVSLHKVKMPAVEIPDVKRGRSAQ